jgi:hypothetical protein
MSFAPIGEVNAIGEAVIGLRLERSVDNTQIRNLLEMHRRVWAEKLPSAARFERHAIDLAQAPGCGSLTIPAVAGVVFRRYKANGEIEWQALLDGPMITVHCCNYSRWATIFEEMKQFLSTVASEPSFSDVPVSGQMHLVRDVFYADTLEEPDFAGLMNRESPLLVRDPWESGPVWHQYLGRFHKHENYPILERINIDSVRESGEPARYRLTIETYHSVDLLPPYMPFSTTVAESTSKHGLWARMHDMSKQVIRSILAEGMQGKIGLLEGE